MNLPHRTVTDPASTLNFERLKRAIDAIEQATEEEGGGGGDAYRAMPFTAAAVVTLDHNLGKRPAVAIVDSSGAEWFMEVEHLSANTCRINFDHPFSGTAYFN